MSTPLSPYTMVFLDPPLEIACNGRILDARRILASLLPAALLVDVQAGQSTLKKSKFSVYAKLFCTCSGFTLSKLGEKRARKPHLKINQKTETVHKGKFHRYIQTQG
ncbi:hypothetical protein J6590_061693 [Homalodisca vitripennis]|nr:hypothetical protein J6590_061693 [Homalodisca vitripennis]